MTAHQPALPTFDMRPICPACKRPSPFLAQWSPGDKVYVCRRCYEKQLPPDVFVAHDNSRGVGLVQGDSERSRRNRDRYHDLINSLDRMRRGCVYSLNDHEQGKGIPCERGGHEPYINCKLCLNEAKAVPRYSRFKPSIAKVDQMSLPICKRCSAVHSRRYQFNSDYQQYCQQCNDEVTIESFWNNRGIFGGDDDESVMDRIQHSHPGLFERGVLPDYWFKLKLAESV